MTPPIVQLSRRRSFRRAGLISLVLLGTAGAVWLWAHEGHQALPTRGATVDLAKGTITLSDEARRALGVQTAEVTLRTIDEHIVAPATLVAPWQRYAFATSRIEGKV